MEKLERNIEKMLILLLCLITLSAVLSLVTINPAWNTEDLTGIGEVYDFSEEELKESSATWSYDSSQEGFWIADRRAYKKFKINGSARGWSRLYVTIGNANVLGLPAVLRYYDQKMEVLSEQNVILSPGQNEISLDASINPQILGFVVRDAEGSFIEITDMQLREKPILFDYKDFFKKTIRLFICFFVGYLLIGYLYKKVFRKKREVKCYVGLDIVQDFFDAVRETVIYNYPSILSFKQQPLIRGMLFSFLFLVSIIGNVLGWDNNKSMYRYYSLFFLVIMWLIMFLCMEKKTYERKKYGMLYQVWTALWIFICVSDYFVNTSIHYQGYIMLFGVGLFFCAWNQMKRPEDILDDIKMGIETIFFITAIVCICFRPVTKYVQYNGIFKNEKENTMFLLLVLVTYLAEIESFIISKRKSKNAFFYVCGVIFAEYFLFLTRDKLGYVLSIVFVIIFFARQFGKRKKWKQWFEYYGKKAVLLLTASCLLVLISHITMRTVSENRMGIWEYNNEILSSIEEKEVFLTEATDETMLKKVIFKEDTDEEKAKAQKQYLRKISLFGKSNLVKVSGVSVSAYNRYLYIIYRYGVLTLVPYLLYQMIVLLQGMGKVWKHQGEYRNGYNIWILEVAVIYIVFAWNAYNGDFFSHPLWLCMYMLTGYFFIENNVSINSVKSISLVNKGKIKK